MEEVRRPTDGELCGHVAQRHGSWIALVIFGAELGCHSTRDGAVAHVLSEGLASLTERWTLRRNGGSEEVVLIQEASPQSVTVAVGFYPEPGMPTLTITASEIAAGEWSMRCASCCQAAGSNSWAAVMSRMRG